MPVSVTNSKLIYDALKACDVKIMSALPETWLVHLIGMVLESLKASVTDVLASNTLTSIVSKVEAVGPKSFHMDLPLLENRFQFKRCLETLNRQIQR